MCFSLIPFRTLKTRVADPHSFHPDPAFQAEYRSGSRALMTKKFKQMTSEKKKKKFCTKTTMYLSLGLHKERPSYRRSLQLSKEAIQTSKHELKKTILLLCVIFALLDPDPDFESGSTDPIESGSHSVADPQPCLKRIILSSISYEK
jgi:hypothetical protein